MGDRSAFERQVQAVLQAAAGPSRPVDAASVVDRVTPRSRLGRISPTTRRFRAGFASTRTREGFTMYSAFKLLAAGLVLGLFGSLLFLGGSAPEDGAVVPAASGSAEPTLTASLDAEAASVRSEVLFELAVPSAALPEDFQGIVIEDLTLAAGTDTTGERTTSQANESMRNRSFIVTSGVFVIEPTTEALLWRSLDATPEATAAGEAVTLRPGEAVYLPAVPADEVDPDKHLRVTNPGSEDATAWSFHAHQASGSAFGGFPSGLTASHWCRTCPAGVRNPSDWLTGGDVLFRLTRHVVDPGAELTLPTAPASAIYFVEAGTVRHALSGPGGSHTNLRPAGGELALIAYEGVEQLLTVEGDEPASILELAATPSVATAAQ